MEIHNAAAQGMWIGLTLEQKDVTMAAEGLHCYVRVLQNHKLVIV
jgi:hypothetical protein